MKRVLVVLAAVMFAAACGPRNVRAQDQSQVQSQAQTEDQGQAQDQAQPPDQPQDQGQAQDQTQDQGQSDSQAQPGVARISLITGDVSVQHAGSGDWVVATVNMPLEAGDRISTGAGSRAEVQLDYANEVRLDENSTLKITTLNRSQIQLQVGQGTVSYDVLEDGGATAEVDTPNVAVHPLQKGEYRVEVPSDTQTVAIVRDGSADASVPQGSTEVDSGQEITVEGSTNPQYKTSNAPQMDDFDNWNRDRDSHIEDAQSWKDTDRYYTGSQDLDQYGHWENVPDYGQVWVPDQGADWAPYRDGQWEWTPYYGWTWVSYEPWGWAPYHYGRWFLYGDYWAWWPGPVGLYPDYYPIWAPAYVSFFGWGGGGFGFGFGFGFGNVGWLPLGPCDRFHRWYGRLGDRYRVENFRDFGRGRDGGDPPLFRGRGISNLDRVETNARLRAGISSMRSNEFGRGRVSMRQSGITAAQFRQSSMLTGRMPVRPSPSSRGVVMRNVPRSISRTASANRERFFSARQAHNVRLSGTRMQERGPSTAGSRGFNAGNRAASAGHRGFTQSSPRSITSSRPGWRTFTPPARASYGGRTEGTSRANTSSNSTRNSGEARGQTFSGRSGQQAPPRSYQHSSPQAGQGGWRHFTPSSSRPQAAPRQNGSARRSGWGSFSSRGNYGSRQLDMRQPIATRRPSSSYYNSHSYGRPSGSYGRPSYSRPSYSRPSYSRPSYSRPSGGGGYRGGGGSRGGGGGSHGASHGGGHPHR